MKGQPSANDSLLHVRSSGHIDDQDSLKIKYKIFEEEILGKFRVRVSRRQDSIRKEGGYYEFSNKLKASWTPKMYVYEKYDLPKSKKFFTLSCQYRTTSTAPARTLGSFPVTETEAVNDPSTENATQRVSGGTTAISASR